MKWAGRSVGATAALLGTVVISGCDAVELLDPGRGDEPRDLDAQYQWIFEGWNQGSAAGTPSVELTWGLPSRYSGEVFRVYARRASSGSYGLIATVTSCASGVCRYVDTNISHGNSYDYYVAAYDERDGSEVASTRALRVGVPQWPNPGAPAAPAAVSLDGAVFLRWARSDGVERYYVVVQFDDGSTFQIGDTDGGSFFDDRAENGNRYRYYLASEDADGHISGLSQPAEAFPRPDYHADIVYAHSDRPSQSGFRFVGSETEDPIVGGTSTSAHWRLESVGGSLRIQPVGSTTITGGVFTTALSCGPGSDEDCEDIRTAPSPSAFSANPVTAQTGFTYVLRVTGSDNQIHYAKIRVQGAGTASNGDRMLVFDWAYQLRANEPSLNRLW